MNLLSLFESITVPDILKVLCPTTRIHFYRPHTPFVWADIYRTKKKLSVEDRRTQRLTQLPDEWTQEVWLECRSFWKGRCAACGRRTGELQKDHLVPISHRDSPGGVPSNLLPLCPSCNKDKSSRDFASWHTHNFNDKQRTERIIERIWQWQLLCYRRGWN